MYRWRLLAHVEIKAVQHLQEIVLICLTILGDVVENVDLLKTLVEELLVILDPLYADFAITLSVGALIIQPDKAC